MLTSYWFINLFLLCLTAIYCFHKYMSRNYDYWKKRNVEYIKPLPIVGNFLDIILFKTTSGKFFSHLYNQTKESVFGIFLFDQPILLLRDPEIIKSVLIRDFNYFYDRTILSSPHDSLGSKMLFSSKNPEWRVTRAKVTPLFTSGKMRTFIPHISNAGKAAVKYIEQVMSNKSNEAKEICAKYTTDVIAKCAFGVSAHSFDNENADFRRFGRSFFDFSWSNAAKQTLFFFAPTIAKLLRLRTMDNEMESFFRRVFWDAINHREKNNVKGNDLVDLIIELRQNKKFCDEFDFVGDKVIAQATQFFIAGFETSSATMAFALYELCIAPEIQKRVRNEIRDVLKEHGEITDETIKNMKYLHMVVCETLRKYPVLPFLDRVCNTDYKIPGTDITIEKGLSVYIPMFGIHYDAEYFPNPEVFDPERFSPENISSIPSCTYIPFGQGPRNCIGERFGLLSTKIGLISILSEFEVERSADTPVPIRMEPKSIVLSSDVGLPMKFKRSASLAA